MSTMQNQNGGAKPQTRSGFELIITCFLAEIYAVQLVHIPTPTEGQYLGFTNPFVSSFRG